MMIKNIAIQSIIGCVIVALLAGSMTACSRKKEEKPKAPEKKVQSFTVAPTPAVTLAASQAITSRVDVARMSPTGMVHSISRRSDTRTPESRKAFQAVQIAAGLEVVKKELDKTQIAYDLELRDLEKTEEALREKELAIRDAYAKVMEVRNAYEEACSKSLAGYSDMKNETDALESQMNDLMARMRKGETVDRVIASEVRQKLNATLRATSKMRKSGNATNPDVAKAFQNVMVVQEAYAQVLAENPEYRQAKQKPDQIAAQIADLNLRKGYYEQEK